MIGLPLDGGEARSFTIFPALHLTQVAVGWTTFMLPEFHASTVTAEAGVGGVTAHSEYSQQGEGEAGLEIHAGD